MYSLFKVGRVTYFNEIQVKFVNSYIFRFLVKKSNRVLVGNSLKTFIDFFTITIFFGVNIY